jgi:hypothetical protein
MGAEMNIRFLALLALVSAVCLASQTAEAADPTISSYTEATATGPFDTAATGVSIGTISTATSPDNTIYYDSQLGYNASGYGSVSQVGGASSQATLFGASSTSASSQADLTIGQLRAGAGTTTNVTGFAIFGWSAEAQFGDTLFFTHPGALPTDVTTVGFSIEITGTLGDIPNGNTTSSGQPFVRYVVSLGSAGGISGIPQGFNQTGYDMVSPVLINQSFGIPSTNNGVLDQIITGTFQFTGAAAIVPIMEDLYVGGQYGYADVTHTATFSFDTLPDGVSFTSASGESLADAVPGPVVGAGPASFAFTALILGWLVRRRGHHAV